MKLFADMVGGAAGDMILGAMIDCGLPLKHLQAEVEKLNLPKLKFKAKKVNRGGIQCLKLEVETGEERSHRTYVDIRALIEESDLNPGVKETALKIFRRLAEAEGAVHGDDPEDVHFHEVGAADSIADIAGAAVGMEYFSAEGFYLSDFLLGAGTVNSSHGILPLPAPATLHLLKGHRIRKIDVIGELTTPTGAAILTACSLGFIPQKPQVYRAFGCGAGTKEYEGLPSYFRLWQLEEESLVPADEIVIEANIDDMNPEIYTHLCERLFSVGAMDVYLTPVIMKKGRPGQLVTATLSRSKLESVSRELFLQSSTIGLRWYPVNRIKLKRGTCTVSTRWGSIPAKWVEIEGSKRIIPEFEECRKVAKNNNVPLQEIYREVLISETDSLDAY